MTIAMYITIPKHTFMLLEFYFIVGRSHQDDLIISLTFSWTVTIRGFSSSPLLRLCLLLLLLAFYTLRGALKTDLKKRNLTFLSD